MSLESEVKELLWAAVASQAAGMDALASGPDGVEVTQQQYVEEVITPLLTAQGEALVRIAQAVDQLRG